MSNLIEKANSIFYKGQPGVKDTKQQANADLGRANRKVAQKSHC